MSKYFYILVGVIILIVLWGFFIGKGKKVELTPSPTPEVVVPDQKYQDMITNKCYNEEELEVSCKG